MGETLDQQSKQQFSDILEELGKTLDITEEQHAAAVRSYVYVGEWLAKEGSLLAPYNPEILPQGSFILGTMTRPIAETDDLDVDLVCRLEGKKAEWTQFDLKKIVGERLKSNGILNKLLRIPDGRRCWTLNYSESAKFHLDVLPSIVSSGYKTILEKAFLAKDTKNVEQLAIRITDKNQFNYKTATEPDFWLKSNPFGYGIWFEQRASLSFEKAILMNEAVQPIPKHRKEKWPLQRVVQILKRHRDMRFNGDEDKPISIIITTLAAKAYQKQSNILEALVSVINNMPSMIEERYDLRHGKVIKWIPNPVNAEENFADKWPENPKRQENFYNWMRQVKIDVENALQQKGIYRIQESFGKAFGENTIAKAFNNYGEKLKEIREHQSLKMSSNTGMLGAVGFPVKNHNFHGK
jgi:hypothetical protein